MSICCGETNEKIKWNDTPIRSLWFLLSFSVCLQEYVESYECNVKKDLIRGGPRDWQRAVTFWEKSGSKVIM